MWGLAQYRLSEIVSIFRQLEPRRASWQIFGRQYAPQNRQTGTRDAPREFAMTNKREVIFFDPCPALVERESSIIHIV
jgi:hypothetical protein